MRRGRWWRGLRGGRHDRLESRFTWLVGSPRSGSTWLANLLAALPGVMMVDEPTVGSHLAIATGAFIGLRAQDVPVERLRMNEQLGGRDDYVFADRYADVWRPLVRDLVLGRYGPQVQEWARRQGALPRTVCFKEPHGSLGADLVLASLPGSRLLFLQRDCRDVIASELDAVSQGSWAASMTEGFSAVESDRVAFVRERAHLWVARIAAVQRAWEAHDPARRLSVRYEELLDDTPFHLGEIAAWLELGADDATVAAVAAALAADRLRDDQRGPGKFVRQARAGGWRDSLDAREQAEVERVAGRTLRELGYA